MEPGERLLDIGCGWGELARFAAENHGVEVVGITVSAAQQKLARECCAGFFRSRQGQLWQLILSKRTRPRIYRSIR